MKLIRIDENTLINPADIAKVEHGTNPIKETKKDSWGMETTKEVRQNTWVTITMKSGQRFPLDSPVADRVWADLQAEGVHE